MWGAHAIGVRRFAVLVRGLPVTARWRFEEHGGWSTADHLLATNAELTHAVYRMIYASIPTKQRKEKIPPLRLPRPGQKSAPKKSWIREWTQKARGR